MTPKFVHVKIDTKIQDKIIKLVTVNTTFKADGQI